MGHVADRHAAPDALEQVLLGDEVLGSLDQQMQHGGSPWRVLISLPSRQSCPVRGSNTNKPKANCRCSAMRQLASAFPGSFPELVQDFLAGIAQFLTRRRQGRNQQRS